MTHKIDSAVMTHNTPDLLIKDISMLIDEARDTVDPTCSE